MARFGQFMKEQLMPEDPLDWIILILVLMVIIGAIVLVSMTVFYGLI